jgi:putative addiction module component (TIGR02574 family)
MTTRATARWAFGSSFATLTRMSPRPHELSVPERILKLQDEWDAIASRADDVPVTSAQAAELDRRVKDHEAAPDDVVPWSEVKRSLRGDG